MNLNGVNSSLHWIIVFLILEVMVAEADVSPSILCSGEYGGVLNCAERRLDRIPHFAKVTDKKYSKVDLSRNEIFTVPHYAFKNIHIAGIDLSGNPLVGISPRAFHGVESMLESLNLNNAGLYVIHWAVFSKLSQLQVLNLSSNHLFALQKELMQDLSSLTNLDLSWNRIERLDNTAFTGLINLKVLNLQGNAVTSVNKDAFAGLNNLQHVYLHSNRLAIFNPKVFSGLEHLVELDLSDNELRSIPSEAFKTLSKLENLRLDENNLTVIAANTFTGAYMLKSISLGFNNIVNVSKDAFLGLKSLETLDISSNNIKFLGSNDSCEISNMEHIKELKLSGNPLDCSCLLSWVADLINVHANVVGTCAEPEKFKSLSVTHADFSQCKNEKFCKEKSSSTNEN